MESVSGIYKITNIKTGQFYIGSSVNIKNRWQNHRSALRNNRHANKHLQSSWNKYGEDAFAIEILERLEPNLLAESENKLLKIYVGTPDCFNMGTESDAAMRGKKHSVETINKMSTVRKGKTKSKEHKNRIKESNIKTWSHKKEDKDYMKLHKSKSSFWKGKELSTSHKKSLEIAGVKRWQTMSEEQRKLHKIKSIAPRSRKITEEIVLNIRKDWETGQFKQIQLAHKYRLNPDHISDIVLRKTWRDL
jgi:group I intron endonuclease